MPSQEELDRMADDDGIAEQAMEARAALQMEMMHDMCDGLLASQATALVQQMVDALNGAVKTDKAAIHALLTHRVPVGPQIVDDPHMIPDEASPGSSDYRLGLLGVLNGCLHAAGLPLIAASWSNEADKLEDFKGFGIFNTSAMLVQ